MAFAAAKLERISMGSKWLVVGTYTNTGGSTGGDITAAAHGLNRVYGGWLQPTGAAVIASAPSINETFVAAGITGAITIVNTADEDGLFFLYGN